MLTETRTITINDEGLEPWLTRLVRAQALLFPEIKKILLFGSGATGTMDRFSDIDLAIATDPAVDAKSWFKITDQVNIAEKNRKVDCVDMNKAPDDLREAILSEGRIIYERG